MLQNVFDMILLMTVVLDIFFEKRLNAQSFFFFLVSSPPNFITEKRGGEELMFLRVPNLHECGSEF